MRRSGMAAAQATEVTPAAVSSSEVARAADPRASSGPATAQMPKRALPKMDASVTRRAQCLKVASRSGAMMAGTWASSTGMSPTECHSWVTRQERSLRRMPLHQPGVLPLATHPFVGGHQSHLGGSRPSVAADRGGVADVRVDHHPRPPRGRRPIARRPPVPGGSRCPFPCRVARRCRRRGPRHRGRRGAGRWRPSIRRCTRRTAGGRSGPPSRWTMQRVTGSGLSR